MVELTKAEFDLLSTEHCDVSQLIRRWLKRDEEGGEGGAVASRRGSGGDEMKRLKDLRVVVQRAAADSASSIKSNVFQNYKQFIETAKDISYLEGEMYQLNHLLTEQKNLIEQIMDISLSDVGRLSNNKSNRQTTAGLSLSETETKKSMQSLLERVEGAIHLADNASRRIVMEGDLAELNGLEMGATVMRNVHCFLMNDGILIASWIAQRLGAQRYKLEAFHPMDNIAAANVKDGADGGAAAGARNVFKLFIFPEHKYFACDTARTKREWLDGIDAAKRAMLQEGSLVRQATIRSKQRRSVLPSADGDATMSPQQLLLTAATPDEKPGSLAPGGSKSNSLEEGGAEWLRELPDELDVCIAQRDFEQAVELLFEGREHLTEYGEGTTAREIGEKLQQKHRQLVEVLSRELRTVQGGGPKAQSKAITLLVRLGKSSQACDLYLKNRTSQLKTSLKEVRIAEDPLSYLRHVNRIVFGALSDVAGEFPRLFDGQPGCCAVLLRWASAEMKNYVTLLLRHVFDPGPSLSVIGQCVTSVFAHTEKLAALGLDLSFEVDTLMSPSVEQAVAVNSAATLDALRLRIAEDRWRANNLQSRANLNRFVEEMSDFGLRLDAFVCDEVSGSDERCRLWVTSSGCAFARAAVSSARDLPALRRPFTELRRQCDDALLAAWRLQLQHAADAVARTDARQQTKANMAVVATVVFLLKQVVPICEQTYTSAATTSSRGGNRDWRPITALIERSFPTLIPVAAAGVASIAHDDTADDLQLLGDV